MFHTVTAAYKHADGKKIDGRRIVVDVERGRTVKNWKPRRLGMLNICLLFVVFLAIIYTIRAGGTNVLKYGQSSFF